MSLTDVGERPVHMPADPNFFRFDAEVSRIFPDMAARSIPHFVQAHHAHARMLERWMQPGAEVIDVGASRGHFLKALENYYPVPIRGGSIKVTALDNSEHMCGYLRTDFPHVDVRHTDITDPHFIDHPQQYDVVCCNYVLQFIDPEMQPHVLGKLIRMVKTNGVLIFGHKSKSYGWAGDAAHEQYIKWRMEMGYSREEIEAKTKALKGSMYPMDHDRLLAQLRLYFGEVQETFRYMMFSSLFAVKF
jgi:tRNA (cmo5U34)-methyltransferase